MAKIELKPGEKFEHIHASESFTKHLEGTLELTFNNQRIVIEEHQIVIIPAKTRHSVKNIGEGVAAFGCSGHDSSGGSH